MSRSGRIPIAIPENTEVKVDGGVIFAKGKLGELSFKFEKLVFDEVSLLNITSKYSLVLPVTVKQTPLQQTDEPINKLLNCHLMVILSKLSSMIEGFILETVPI